MHVKEKRNNKPDRYETMWNFSFSLPFAEFLPFPFAIGSNECHIAAIPLLVCVFANMFDETFQYPEIFHHGDIEDFNFATLFPPFSTKFANCKCSWKTKKSRTEQKTMVWKNNNHSPNNFCPKILPGSEHSQPV